LQVVQDVEGTADRMKGLEQESAEQWKIFEESQTYIEK